MIIDLGFSLAMVSPSATLTFTIKSLEKILWRLTWREKKLSYQAQREEGPKNALQQTKRADASACSPIERKRAIVVISSTQKSEPKQCQTLYSYSTGSTSSPSSSSSPSHNSSPLSPPLLESPQLTAYISSHTHYPSPSSPSSSLSQ